MGVWMCTLMFLPFMAISHVLAEAPDTIWTRTYGGESNDEAFKVIETSDGFFVLAGYTESFGAGGSDVYLLKLDSNGDDIWIKTYGGEGNDAAYSVMETSDGYYVVAGYTGSFGTVVPMYMCSNWMKTGTRSGPELMAAAPMMEPFLLLRPPTATILWQAIPNLLEEAMYIC